MLRPSPRGFTLVELMVVIVIVGVLGTIGVSSFRSRIFGSKSTEALAVIQSIRAAEERYKAENLVYLDVSTGWYPAAPSGREGRAFYLDDSACAPTDVTETCLWRKLAPTIPGPVAFGYRVNAGGPDDVMTTPAIVPSDFGGWNNPGVAWYVIQAAADADGDGKLAYFLASSAKGGVYSQDDGE